MALCLIRYLIKSSDDYGHFCNDKNTFREQNPLSDNEVLDFIEETNEQLNTKPSCLSEAEEDYLTTTAHYAKDWTFLESYDWFERIPNQSDYLSRYFDLVFDLASAIEESTIDDSHTLAIHPKNADVKILFRHFTGSKRTLLIAPVKNQSDEKYLRDKYNAVLRRSDSTLPDIARYSRRAYPSVIAWVEKTWMNVQKSVEANLALSPEEEDLLLSVTAHHGGNAPRYPLFINGRPGSGKSTILQYLFADYVYVHIRHTTTLNNPGAPPLYLTYSTLLRDDARKSIANIIACDHKRQEHNQTESLPATEIEKLLESCIQNFRDYLLSMVPRNQRGRFPVDKHVDFYRFRQLWEKRAARHPRPEVRSISAELAWHTIRTFIKGMQDESGSVIIPEYYRDELPKEQKSVSDVAFEQIYQHVWESWYKGQCNRQDYWDDQDLTRYILNASMEGTADVGADGAPELNRHPAVFCDESQDFTNIELELIERLSLYSRREVPDYHIKNIPFVFAGDPFQTVNPTGFNWKAVRARFHENISQQLAARGGNANILDFNFKELKLNYRSSEQIVKLSNAVQLVRAVLLRTKDVLPQQSWAATGATSIPFTFRQDDVLCREPIMEQKELVIIVPCEENGELEYVRGDAFLEEFALSKDRAHVTRNVLSPAHAKGLEYNRVLLYRFGDHAVNQLPELLEYICSPATEPPGLVDRLKCEYFMNQFYVAMTRARKQLFIVDSEESLREFWAFTGSLRQREFLDLKHCPDGWSADCLGGVMPGDKDSWNEDRDNLLQIAKQFRDQGKKECNRQLLMLAKRNYEYAGKQNQAQLTMRG